MADPKGGVYVHRLEARRIEAIAKKGGVAELMQCGSHTLARFAITSVFRQAEPPST